MAMKSFIVSYIGWQSIWRGYEYTDERSYPVILYFIIYSYPDQDQIRGIWISSPILEPGPKRGRQKVARLETIEGKFCDLVVVGPETSEPKRPVTTGYNP